MAVAQTGSFSGAARRLGISQSALSQAVQQLEGDLGVRLLDRTTRSVQLSAVGRDFLPGIQRVLADLEHQLQDLKDLKEHRRGHVAVTCVPSVALRLLPSVLARFQAAYPMVSVSVREAPRHQIITTLRSGDAELGIANVPGDDPELDSTFLLTDTFALVMRRDHPLAALNEVTWLEASDTGLIAMAPGTGIRLEMDRGLPVAAAPHHEAEHPATLLAMVEAGVGVAPLPSLAWPQEGHPVLTFRPLVAPRVERQLFLIKRAGRDLSPAGRSLHRTILAGALREDFRGAGWGDRSPIDLGTSRA